MTVPLGQLGYWLVSVPGIKPGDDVEAELRSRLPIPVDPDGDAVTLTPQEQAVLDGFDELLATQSPYAPAWHTVDRTDPASPVGFVVVAPIVDEQNQHASANILALMGRLMARGLTILPGAGPLTAAEACEVWGDVR